MNKKINKNFIKLILFLAFSLTLVGCGSQDNKEDVSKVQSQAEVQNKEQVIDENTGLVYKEDLNLEYAEHFKVEYYEDGYKIIVDASDRKILVVPEGKEIPVMKEEIPVIQQPIDSFGIYSTIDPSWFRPLDEVDKITVVTAEEEKWKTDEMISRMKNGEAIFIGDNDALDYELLQESNPSLNLLSKSNEEKLFPKFDELDLPYLSMGAYIESDPRGRLEWTKLIGALLNKEEKAETYFKEELARIDKVQEKIQDTNKVKPKVTMAYFSASSQEFKVTNVEGYKVKQIEMGGGLYYPEDLGLDTRGSTAMTAEEFYKTMSETDILIYDSVSGHEIQDLDAMIERADYLADTKLFQEGRIWGLKRDFWQAGEKIADMAEEYYEIFYSPHGEIEETNYFYLMK